MRNKTLTALIAIGFVSIVSGHAQAQTTAGALQLGLGTNFVTYSSENITEHQPQPNGTTLDYKQVERNTNWGLANNNGVTLEGGYGITDILVLGGLLEMGGWSHTYGPDAATAGDPKRNDFRFSFFIAPKIDVMFLPDSVVRPFVGAAVGLVRNTLTQQTTDQANVTRTPVDFGATGIGLLGRVGIRWFLTPGFSLDPAFVFGYNAGSGSTVVPAGGAATQSLDTSVNGYSVGLRLGLSGWIGL